MKARQKTWILVLAALAVVGLVILASGIDTLDLNSGTIYILPESEQETREPLPPAVDQPSSKYLGILTLVFMIVLPISLIYLLLSPDARRRFFAQVIQISMIVLLLYLFVQNFGRIFPNLREGLLGGMNADLQAGEIELRFLEPFSPQNPAWLIELLSFALAAGFLFFLFWLWRKLHPAAEDDDTPAEKLVRSAKAAIRQIDAGQNLRDVVLRCYHDMTQAVAEKRHLTRPEYATPHEFIRSLEVAGLPADQVRRLTYLFESVRYGHKIPGVQERTEAVACLNAVISHLGGQP